MQVTINNVPMKLSANTAIGKGGEADIYDIGNHQVAKIFKNKKHPDLAGMPSEQQAAENRLKEHQTKLIDFPKHLPSHVITPIDLVYDKNRIVGYTMPFIENGEVLLRYTEKSFRMNVKTSVINDIFLDLHSSVIGLHDKKVVIGDFNDLNVIVAGNKSYIIDADSMQFSNYPCRVYTAKFVDPVLCKPDQMVLAQPHNAMSDWYAFNVMLFQCLLFVGPYGGVYKPVDKTKKVGPDKRPLHRITVFNSEVQYPKPANRPDILPDDLLQHFHNVFEKDMRNVFPRQLIETLEWTVCKDCGCVHAKSICPNCGQKGVGKIVQTVRVRGTVTATSVFKTHGRILYAVVEQGKLRWLYHEDNKFKRDHDITVMPGNPENTMRFRICGDSTLIAKGRQLVTIDPNLPIDRKSVDTLGWLPAIDANGTKRFWIENGRLLRDNKLGRDYGHDLIGDVLRDQTQFWVGEKLGFGYYRAGEYYGAFVFNTESGGLNNTVEIPVIKGQIIDSTCVISDRMVWFFVKVQENGKTINRVFMVDGSGTVVGEESAIDGDGSWLGNIRGKFGIKNILMSSTDDGIVRIEMVNGRMVVTKEFPDTEPFVTQNDHLFPGTDGIFVVNRNEIVKLKLQ